MALIESKFNPPPQQDFPLKNIRFFQNKNSKQSHQTSSVVIMIQMKRWTIIPRLISQGLCSNGIDVVLIYVKTKRNKKYSHNNPIDVVKQTITLVKEQVIKSKIPGDIRFYFIFYSRPGYFLTQFSKNRPIIQINPVLDENYIKTLTKFNCPSFIFSQSGRFIQNSNIKALLKFKSNKLEENLYYISSRMSFKNYESILLAMILNIIERNNHL